MKESNKIAELYVEIKASTEKLKTDIKKFVDDLKREGDNFEKKFSSSFKNAFGFIAGYIGASQLIGFIRNSINAWEDQERAILKLDRALQNAKIYSKAYSDELLTMADSLQKVTNYQDEQITMMQAQLFQFGATKGNIRELTTATLDLAAGMGMDLDSAARLMGKAIVGSTAAFSKYGIELKGVKDEGEKLEIILAALEKRFGGQAQAMYSGTTKEINNLKKAFGELEEKIGEVSAPELTKFIYDVKEGLSAWERTLQRIKNFFSGLGWKTNSEIPTDNDKNLQEILNKNKPMDVDLWKFLNKPPKYLPFTVPEKKKTGDENKGGGPKSEFDVNSVLDKYYSQRKFKDGSYFDWRIKELDKQVKEYRKAKINEKEITEYIEEEKTKLVGEALEYIIGEKKLSGEMELEQDKKLVDLKNKNYEMDLINLKENNIEKIEAVKETQNEIIQQMIDSNVILASEQQALVDGFNAMFDDLVIKSDWANSVLEQGMVAFANSFISQVKRMAAEWLAFQTLKMFGGFLLSPLTGGASMALGAHSGGEFIGTNKGILKLAGGGSFTVPSGYPNDSYPLFVESREKVKVTPASGSNDDTRLLGEIVTSIRAMNMNLVNLERGITIINNSPNTETIVRKQKGVENDLSRKGLNLERL